MPALLMVERCGTCGAELTADGVCPACMLDRGWMAEAEMSASAESLSLPSFGDYELLEEIARGGMGVVYKARQRSLNRIVAVKMVLAGRLAKAVDLQRFRAEAAAAARLQHPNIVAIHEVGELGGQPFFSMDYVEGRSLAEIAYNQPLLAKRAADYLKSIAEAVHYAHSRGVLHRDLKPSNILVDQHDQPRITDFGLAKRLGSDSDVASLSSDLTITGQVLGSPNFMPPEQATGDRRKVGPASDVYSLGAVLYQLLTGRPPFAAEALTQILRLVAEAEPVAPRLLNPGVPRDLETVCLKCLEKEPSRRYTSAQALAEDLGCYLRDEPIRARPVSPAERAWRWCCRNRALAGTGAAVLILLLTVAIGSPIALVRIRGEKHRAEASARNEEKQRLRAEESAARAQNAANLEAQQRSRAENAAEEERVNLYAARIVVAERALRAGNAENAVQILNSLRPQPGQRDLRSFDWYYLWHSAYAEEKALPHAGGVFAVAVSPDGGVLATGGDEKIIRFWNTTNGLQSSTMKGHRARITALAFSPDGKRLASAGADATVHIWERDSTRETQVLTNGGDAITCLAFSPDGRILAAGEGVVRTRGGNPTERYQPVGGSGMVALWNLDGSARNGSFKIHHDSVVAVAFSRDGRALISCGTDRTVTSHDCATGGLLAIQTNFSGNIFGITLTPDGKEVAVASWSPHNDESGEIRILDSATLELKRVFSSDAGKALCIAIAADGSRLACAGADNIVRLWEYPGGARLAAFSGHNNTVGSLVFMPDRRLASADAYGAVKIWRTDLGTVRQRIPTTNSYSLAFSPDGELLACGGRGVELRDAATGALRRTLDYVSGDVRVAFSPDGSLLAATGNDQRAHFWDRKTWQHWLAPGSSVPTNSVEYVGAAFAFSPNSRMLAVSGEDSVIRLLDAHTGGLLEQIQAKPRPAFGLAFAAEETLLTGDPRRINFWDLKRKAITRTILQNATLLRLSPDGRWLASASAISAVGLHEFPTMVLHGNLSGHTDWLWCLEFSHDSRLLATASWDGAVILWHVETGQELLSFRSHSGVVWSVAFSPNDRTLAFGSGANMQGSGFVTILRAASDEMASKKQGRARLPLRTAEELARSIPPRSSNCPPNLVDLGPWFNASFTNSSLTPRFGRHDFSALPTGVQNLGGVWFDLRGIVQVSCAANELSYDYPVKVAGIRVSQKCQKLHFLQSAAWLETWGTHVADYVVHFDDGTQETVPLLYGNHLQNWIWNKDDPGQLSASTTAVWGGPTPALAPGAEIRAYDFCWENSHPDRKVETIDFESAMSVTGPMLLAITVDDGSMPKPKAWVNRANQGKQLARKGRWQEAMAQFKQALQADPANQLLYHLCAPLFVAAGDARSYRQHCQLMRERFEETRNPVIAGLMAKNCLILSDSGVSLQTIDKWATTAVTLGTNSSVYAYFQQAKGWVAYREGDFREAEVWLQKAATAEKGRYYLFADTQFLLAMTEYRLSDLAKARAALAKGTELVDAQHLELRNHDIGEDWNDWIIAQVLANEARVLIEGKADNVVELLNPKPAAGK